MLRPPVEEQKQIFEAVDALAAQIRIEESLFAKLICQKSGLMNDLLTGRVRVPENIIDGGGQS
jgi:type I restriction enzyme S subunit